MLVRASHAPWGAQELYRWTSVAEAGRKALGMRYRLLPFLYTAFHASTLSGTPVAQPLFFCYPADPRAHDVGHQWLLGGAVLVTPVLEQGVAEVTLMQGNELCAQQSTSISFCKMQGIPNCCCVAGKALFLPGYNWHAAAHCPAAVLPVAPACCL